MEKILIGIVTKPQGVMGQIKLKDFTDGFEAIKDVDEVFIGDKTYKVLAKKSVNGAIYLDLKGVSDRDAAESLRGAEVYCDKALINVEEGRYFIADLIGCDLYLSSGKKIGVITDITSLNTDVIWAKTEEGLCSFPFVKKLEAVFDRQNKRFTVNAAAFTEVCLYSK